MSFGQWKQGRVVERGNSKYLLSDKHDLAACVPAISTNDCLAHICISLCVGGGGQMLVCSEKHLRSGS
jgi:hypothetical protein